MSVPLEDLRARVTARGHCALVAYSRAHAIDKSELVRDIIEAWASKQIHGASMLQRCLRAKGETAAAEGICAASKGIAGNDPESLEWGSDE